MNRLYIIETDSTVPYHNLALEETLLETVRPGECILYLWQNRQTVVIGRNQSASNECRIQKLEGDGGFLARRLSGGGAVYHDMGNLNFTFLACADEFSKEKQTEVILRAVRAAGINAEKNGRNDLTADGRKFSGHAYYRTKNQCYHHGTIMLDVDKSRLSDYLNVSPLKLSSKGVASVRSRVVNLHELKPELEISELKARLREAFMQVYGLPAQIIREEELDCEALAHHEAKYASPQWKYGGELVLERSCERRFEWGQARLDYELSEGSPRSFGRTVFYSDGLDADYLSEIGSRLSGCALNKEEITARLTENDSENNRFGEAVRNIAEDIAAMIDNIENAE